MDEGIIQSTEVSELTAGHCRRGRNRCENNVTRGIGREKEKGKEEEGNEKPGKRMMKEGGQEE